MDRICIGRRSICVSSTRSAPYPMKAIIKRVHSTFVGQTVIDEDYVHESEAITTLREVVDRELSIGIIAYIAPAP